VLAVRQARQQAEDAVAAGGVGADGRWLLAPIAAPPVATPPLCADPSYDIWSLGVLLFTLRAGRPPFDSATGDREVDTDMILDAVATATDESILALLKQQQRSRLVKLQDNEVSLLRHMMAVAPEERFTIDEVAAALEGMLHGLSATQKVKSLDRMVSAVRDVGVGMAAVSSQIKLGHKQMAKIDSGLQGVEQQVKQVKVGVKAVAAQVAVVAEGVSGLAEGQHRISQTLVQVHSLCVQLEAQAQATLRAVFDVAQGGDVPRLFTLLPDDSLSDDQRPPSAAQTKSRKAHFLALCDDIAKGAARAQ
jgi:archaellum component FlaC